MISGYGTFQPPWAERLADWASMLVVWPMQARMMAVLERNIEQASAARRV